MGRRRGEAVGGRKRRDERMEGKRESQGSWSKGRGEGEEDSVESINAGTEERRWSVWMERGRDG